MIFRVFAYYYNSAQKIWFLDGGFRSLLSSLMQSYELFPQFQFHLTRVGPYKMSLIMLCLVNSLEHMSF